MDKIRWLKIDRYSKKFKAINYLGGKCEKCGENSYYKLCFHHKEGEDKDLNISEILRWSIIEKELKKCSLLCYNCHHELHYDIDGYRTRNKKILLEYVNNIKCEKCGYDKCSGSLDFHHIEPKNKIITISRLLLDSGISDIKRDLEEELQKCIVLCKNCHMDLHFNDGFFDNNYEEILEKSKNIKEIKYKLDKIKIKELHDGGMNQKEISKHFEVSKGTISNIFKIMKLR